MAAFFVSDLTEATGTTITAHVPSVGTSWTQLWRDSTPVGQCTATGLRSSGNGGNAGWLYTADVTYPSADYFVEFTLVAAPGATAPLYVCVRIADQENLYAVRLLTGTGTCQLYKKVAGTWGALGSLFDCPAAASVCKIEMVGSALKFYDDGVEVATATDSALTAAGTAGLGQGGGAELVVSTDDVAAAVVIKDMSITEAAGGPTVLVVADVTHAHETDNTALVQAYVLTVADVGHGHGAENVALEQAYLLAVADATHSHTADTFALTQAYTLAVADAEHVHTADNVTISPDAEGDVTLTVADVEHLHAADSLALVQGYVLVVADATHSHTADTLALVVQHVLTVADAAHAHTAETVVLDFHPLVTYSYPGTRDVRRAKGRGELLSDAPGRARAKVRQPIEAEG